MYIDNLGNQFPKKLQTEQVFLTPTAHVALELQPPAAA